MNNNELTLILVLIAIAAVAYYAPVPAPFTWIKQPVYIVASIIAVLLILKWLLAVVGAKL